MTGPRARYLLITAALGAWSGTLHAQPGPTTEAIRLQANGPHVRHVVDATGYRIEVRCEVEVIGAPAKLVELQSVEPGTWENLRIAHGRFIKPTRPLLNLQEQARQQPRQAVAIELQKPYGFEATFDAQPGRAKLRFDEEMAKITKDAEAAVDAKHPGASNREQLLKTEVRKLCAQTVAALAPNANKPARFMGQPSFVEQRANPQKTLEDLLRWLEFDLMLAGLQAPVNPKLPERKRFDYAQEVMDVVTATERPAETPFLFLDEAARAELARGCRGVLAVDFRPYRETLQRDDGWRTAFRLGLLDDGPGRVRWQATVGGGEGRASTGWLQFRTAPDAAVQISMTGDAPHAQAMLVEGPQGWRFVRLAAVARDRAATVEVEVATDASRGPTIRIPEPIRGQALFPY
jgi:hypothetical protein